MISSDFKPYVLEILNFLRGVSIKYPWIADQTNAQLMANNIPVNLDDPTTWKYYLNLVGEYHPSDTIMTVISLDTLQSIPFTKEVLKRHPRTVVSYYPGTAYFKSLCDEYPTQKDLIKSILFPVSDIQTAIAAKPLTLLAWPETFLEDPERPMLVAALSQFLDIYRERWWFTFLEMETYFHPTTFGTLYAEMAAFLMAKRHQYIHTPYVHSWHIRNYLQSKGLDDYSDVLTRKKQIFLYQNWDYLKINSGKQSNLIILIQELLSDMGISIYGRRVLMETETGENACVLTPRFIPDNLLGTESKLVEEIQAETTQEMQQRLYAQGLTPSQASDTVAALVRKLGDTTKNNYLTKFLEIKPVEVDYRYEGMLDQFILDTLVKAVTSGRYNATVMVQDPLTLSNYWITTKEALALYDYCVRKSNMLSPTDIPTQYTYVLTLKDTAGVPPDTFWYQGTEYRISNLLNASSFLGNWTWPSTLKTVDQFSALVSQYWLLFLVKFQNLEYAGSGLLRVAMRTVLSAGIEKNTTDTFTLIPGFTDYATWLSGVGVNFQGRVFNAYDESLQPTELYGQLADNIMGALFQADTTIRQYGNFALSDNGYTRLRKLFIQLTSYTVRFLETNQDGEDYIYIGNFVFDDTQQAENGSLDLYPALKFLERTQENSIESQLVLSNTVSLAEQTTETSERDIGGITLYAEETVSESQTTGSPIHLVMTEDAPTDTSATKLSFGFDFSGFAP